jgi:hypothetical protein
MPDKLVRIYECDLGCGATVTMPSTGGPSPVLPSQWGRLNHPEHDAMLDRYFYVCPACLASLAPFFAALPAKPTTANGQEKRPDAP